MSLYNDFYCAKANTDLVSQSFAVTGPGLWNSVPLSVRLAGSVVFRSGMKSHLF